MERKPNVCSFCLAGIFIFSSLMVSKCHAAQDPTQHAADRGVRLLSENSPSYINANGEPFTAKGVIYYQPSAAHHYFLENLDLAQVPQDLKKFREIGFNTIGIDVSWGELFAAVDPDNNYLPAKINADRVEKLKKLAQITQDEGFYLYISPGVQIVPPQIWGKVFEASTDGGGNFHPSFTGYLIRNWLVDEKVNAGFIHFLEFTGKTLSVFNNVLGYAFYYELMEQQFPWCHDDYLLVEKWQQYLTDRHPDVNYWNKRWNENYKTVKDIQLPYRNRDYWRPYYDGVLKTEPRESDPLAWRDCYDFMMVAIGWEGRYGMSFPQMAEAIRRGDPDALIVWKAHDPHRYAWELGVLEELKSGTLPPDAENILKKSYSYPGVDIIACDGYPNAEKDPYKRAEELTFKRNFDRAKAIKEISALPFYCQEYGINHHQWSFYESQKYLKNAIKGYQELGAIGYNVWQSQDYYGGANWDKIQPNFGILDINGNPHPTVEAIAPLLGGKAEEKSNLPGLYVEAGQLMRKGKPYSGIGVNYFDAFYRVLKDTNDKSYKDGFKVLKEKYDIPFVRFMAGGYWPTEWKLYLENKQRYFELMDELVAEAEKQEVGLIPSLFWYVGCVPDIVCEPMDQIGNPESKTVQFFKTYTKEMVSRYIDSPAIWAWEFGNEHILAADIPRKDDDLNFGRARIVPEMGTPTERSERDRFTRTAIHSAYRIFADEVRKLDPHRMIITGDATPSENSYHRHFQNTWEADTQKKWERMLISDNPGSIDSISIHIYPSLHDDSYFPEKVSVAELIGICNKTASIDAKPLFVGEFGAPKTMGSQKAKKYFFDILAAIEDHKIPLSALWVFDFPYQDTDWNVTANNEREYMLQAIKEANSRINKP